MFEENLLKGFREYETSADEVPHIRYVIADFVSAMLHRDFGASQRALVDFMHVVSVTY